MHHTSHSMSDSADYAIRHRYGDTLADDKASGVVPGVSSTFRRPPSLRRVVIEGDYPGFIGTTRTLRLPAIHPAATSFPSLQRYHGYVGLFRSRVARRRSPQGQGADLSGHPITPLSSVEMAGSPKFPHRPSCRPAHAPSTPDRPDEACLNAPSDAATGQGTTVALSMDFRGSIAWLDGLLSTLQSAGALPTRCKTRFSPARLRSGGRASHPLGLP